MADQAALQEAIQRARQIAAKAVQNAPAIKRPASELDDHTIGQVKVTLAYEKPANRANINHASSSDNNNQDLGPPSSHHHQRQPPRSSSNHRDYNNRDSNHSSERDDRDSGYLGSSSNDNNYSSSRNNNHPPSSGGYSMLGGNYSSGEEKIDIIIPHAVIGLVIGKGGENIKRIQNETGATVRVDPTTVDEKGNKVCTITGTKQAVEDAHSQVSSVIENAANNKRPRRDYEGSDQYRMKIPASRTGAIIGKGGETIKSIKQQSGCDIELDKQAKECGPDESVFIIRGTQDKILKARGMIEARLASRGRDGDGAGSRSGGGSSSYKGGVATGANAAPVAQFADLPANYPAAGQQSSTDVSAAWAAYFAQYSNMFSQTGAVQPGATGMQAYVGQQTLLGASGATPQQQQQVPGKPETQQSQQVPTAQGAQQPQQDYSDQWIEFYLQNGRADYAEQIIEMKKQQQQKQQQQQQAQNP